MLSEDIRNPPICRTFEAKLHILYHEGSVRNGFQATVHVKGVMQTATVISMGEQEVSQLYNVFPLPWSPWPLSENAVQELYTGDEATVKLQFIKQPEYLTCGSRLLFRHGQFKSMGTIVKIFPLDDRLSH